MNALCFLFLPCSRWLIAVLLTSVPIRADEAVLSADFSVHTGAIRPLHGINKGPLAPGGILDVIQEQKELGIPFTRLHDCGWPNPYVVDHHAVFPNPNADPALPESYDFRLTDEYIAAVRKTGAEPIYRLGESIEHTSVKRHVHPPADMEKWAAVCVGIIRHYNDGWASGFHHNIRYWEIWNEPENPPVMWSGTDDDYMRLYRTAATAIKRQFPALKVGVSFVQGEFVPTDFAVSFLAMCRKEKIPLNFFSWHCYTADPAELTARSRAIRRLLDLNSFTETENHLNEWNFLPYNTWKPITKSGTPAAHQRHYEDMAGAPGAAFVAAALVELQNAPACGNSRGRHGKAGLSGRSQHGRSRGDDVGEQLCRPALGHCSELERLPVIEPFYPKGERGRPPIGLERMLRVYFLQQWYGLADEALEDALYDSQSLQGFARIDLVAERVAEATTLLIFRRLLEPHNLCYGIFAAINADLSARGAALHQEQRQATRPGNASDKKGQSMAFRSGSGKQTKICPLLNSRRHAKLGAFPTAC